MSAPEPVGEGEKKLTEYETPILNLIASASDFKLEPPEPPPPPPPLPPGAGEAEW
jgi:hypothetical protein